MRKLTDAVTLGGNPITLVGEEVGVGDKAPDFTVIGNDLSPVKLSDYAGKVVVISAVPSLDTEICDVETRRFNQEAAGLGEEVVILTVSVDLPFAQKRWCAAAGVDRVVTASDHAEVAFGQAYGVLIEGARLLARSIFVVDKEGKIIYTQLVPEIGQEPEYQPVIDSVKSAL